MEKEKWKEFLLNYYGYEFNLTLEESAKNDLRFQREIGLPENTLEKQLKVVAIKRKKKQYAIEKFVEKYHDILDYYLKLGFEIQEYTDKNYFGEYKRSKLTKNLTDGFVANLIFHIEDPSGYIDEIEISISFPKKVNGIGGIFDKFNYTSRIEFTKNLKSLFECVNNFININIDDFMKRFEVKNEYNG